MPVGEGPPPPIQCRVPVTLSHRAVQPANKPTSRYTTSTRATSAASLPRGETTCQVVVVVFWWFLLLFLCSQAGYIRFFPSFRLRPKEPAGRTTSRPFLEKQGPLRRARHSHKRSKDKTTPGFCLQRQRLRQPHSHRLPVLRRC